MMTDFTMTLLHTTPFVLQGGKSRYILVILPLPNLLTRCWEALNPKALPLQVMYIYLGDTVAIRGTSHFKLRRGGHLEVFQTN